MVGSKSSILCTALFITDFEIGNRVVGVTVTEAVKFVIVVVFVFVVVLVSRLGFLRDISRFRTGGVNLPLATHLSEFALTTFNTLVGVFCSVRRGREPRHLASQEIANHHLGHAVQVRFASLEEPTTLAGQDTQELNGVLDVLDAVGAFQVLGLDASQNSGDVLFGVFDVFHTDDTAKQDVFFGVVLAGRDNTGTVDQVDSSHQGDVLPDLGFSGNRGHGADLLLAQSVDNGRFACVGVSNKPDTDLFAVRMQRRELSQQLDQGTFAKRVVDRRMECKCRVVFRQMSYPCSLVKLAFDHYSSHIYKKQAKKKKEHDDGDV